MKWWRCVGLPLGHTFEDVGLAIGDKIAVERHGATGEVGVYRGAGLIGAACEGELHGGRYGTAYDAEAIVYVAITIGRHALTCDGALYGDTTEPVGAIGEVVEGSLHGALVVLARDVVGAGGDEAGDTIEEIDIVGLEYPTAVAERFDGLGIGCGVLLGL